MPWIVLVGNLSVIEGKNIFLLLFINALTISLIPILNWFLIRMYITTIREIEIIRIPRPKRRWDQWTVASRAAADWNSLDKSIRSFDNLNSFKKTAQFKFLIILNLFLY